MIRPFVVKVNLVKLLFSSVLMSFAFLKSWRKEVDVSPLVVLAKLKVVASVKAAAKSNCFIFFVLFVLCQRVFQRSANFFLSLRISELGFCLVGGVSGLDMSGVRF